MPVGSPLCPTSHEWLGHTVVGANRLGNFDDLLLLMMEDPIPIIQVLPSTVAWRTNGRGSSHPMAKHRRERNKFWGHVCLYKGKELNQRLPAGGEQTASHTKTNRRVERDIRDFMTECEKKDLHNHVKAKDMQQPIVG